MKLTPKDRIAVVELFRDIRNCIGVADVAAAELTASTFGIEASEVLKLAFFDGQEPPPQKGPSAAGLFVVRRSTEAA